MRAPIRNIPVVSVAAATLAALTLLSAACRDGDDSCVSESERAAGIKVTLVTVWNGNPEFLPAGIGVEDGCAGPVHTFDDSSYVYISDGNEHTVGDFFEVWEDSPDERPGSAVENVSLNGQPYTDDYRAIVFKDDDRIVVAFGDRLP